MFLVVPYIVDVLENEKRRMSPVEGFTMLASPLRPDSPGSVHLRSSDPAAPARIDLRLMETEQDRRLMINAVRKAREIVGAAPLADVVAEELLPGTEISTDAAIVDELRKVAANGYHLIGTCRMGTTPMSVVNERLQVHGMEGLRVADASVMPSMLSGTPAITTMLIGEKCAELILTDARS